ncbi:MAG TPA: translation initiation factor IF-3 [Candidatus Omnitrophota bacterium]|nr:translation initiation factor IF-3 [Candidatus Omnitrophota bacterium]HPD84579.1 translation initiation factor IF-3 [Candidatus Omnitrophota bacterium]HRZ03437.1 translation initiation factor IF-3 [Candidatus Omnitrophota bacterium]
MVDIQKYIRVNERINSPEVRVIGPNAEQIGVLVISRALEMARGHGLDLVEVAPTAKPPVCRIIDFSKYKYEQQKKERRVKKSQKIVRLKQIRVKPHIDEHDYQNKLKQAIAFLDRKDKVKINLFYRGREMAFQDLGRGIINKFIADMSAHGMIEKNPSMEGRVLSVVFSPKADKA